MTSSITMLAAPASAGWCPPTSPPSPASLRDNDSRTVPRSTAGQTLAVLLDATPVDGPFTPRPAGEAMLYSDGSAGVPWPILRRFIDLIEMSGDIVGDGPAEAVNG